MTKYAVLLASAAALLLSVVAPSAATESSERLYSQGLVEFHAGRYEVALRHFDAAVAADPRDAVALYYRGVTRGRVEDYAGAVADLRASLALPGHPARAALELGVALLEDGRAAEAIAPLQQAVLSSGLEARASFFLGIAYLRGREFAAAESSFARAQAADASLAPTVQYYRGVIAYERSDPEAAAALFQSVVDSSPQTEVGREAGRFLAILRGGSAQPYHVFARTGFLYDSNVTLVANDPPSGNLKREDDGSAIFHVGGEVVPTLDPRATLVVGYDLFQSLHFDLTRYDLQRHRPYARLTSDLGIAQLGLAGDYEYSLLSSDSFLSEGKLLPWIAVPQGEWGRSEIFFRFRRRDFKDRDYASLTGFNYSAGLRQTVFLGAPLRFVSLGYRYDNEVARDRGFSYEGNEVNVGVQGELPALVVAQLGYAYRHERYASASATMTDGRRRDNEQHVGLTVSRLFFDLLNVDLSYFFTYNGSSQKAFEYDRNIVSLSVRVDL